MIVSATMASIYSVCLIAIDRYLYIVHGIKYQIWVTSSRVYAMIVAVWIIGK